MTRTENISWAVTMLAVLGLSWVGHELLDCQERNDLAREQAKTSAYLHQVQALAYGNRSDLCQCGCDQQPEKRHD